MTQLTIDSTTWLSNRMHETDLLILVLLFASMVTACGDHVYTHTYTDGYNFPNLHPQLPDVVVAAPIERIGIELDTTGGRIAELVIVSGLHIPATASKAIIYPGTASISSSPSRT